MKLANIILTLILLAILATFIPTKPRWEYKSIPMRLSSDYQNDSIVLGIEGREGWEMIQIEPPYIVFKRKR